MLVTATLAATGEVALADPPQVMTTNVSTFTESTTWTCPDGISVVKVECWGAGGAGGSAARTANPGSAQYGGGGAGGAYARYNSFPVIPGNTYYINVGVGGFNNSSTNDTTVPGGDSWFNSINQPSTSVLAKGGAGGESAIGSTTGTRYGTGGAGTTAGSVGDVVYAGGSGKTGAANAAGGGGSSAGTDSNGTSATSNIGAVAPAGGGNGGTGPTTSGANGGAGYPPPGGGGGGARDASGDDKYLRSGGVGGRGQVVLTYATLGAAASATAAMPTGDGSGSDGLSTYAQRTLITLTETPSAGTPPFTYAWRKVGSPTILSSNRILVVSSPVNGDQYTCDVAATWDGVVSTSPPATITVTTNINPAKVIFIKADDLVIPAGQGDFLAANRELGIKVGIGFTCSTVDGVPSATQWIQEQQAAGDVEFWNHAWDHLQWINGDGNEISEYEGSGLAHMREHMALTQTSLTDACGVVPVAFGSAYNGFDTDTATVINETTPLRVFFTHRVSYAKSLLSPRMSVVQIYSESLGVGMPDADSFKAAFPPGTQGPAALQFHPSAFDPQRLNEYRKIVTYLLTNGYSILLPREFVSPETLIAGFNGSPTNGGAPLTVTFTDTSTTGAITNRFWNFGDGTTTNTTALSLSHVYQVPGTNTVTLIVSDATGSSTNIKTNLIVATYEPPQLVTNFTSSSTWVCPPNVTSVKVQCWGGGGGGGSASRTPGSNSTQYGGGGGGGAYACYNSYPVIPGNTYYINVGEGGFNTSATNATTVPGGDSWFNSINAPSTVILAKGGAGGESAVGNTTTTRYGAGGLGTTNGSAGEIVYAGGSGAPGAASAAGGGGSSAGTNVKGNNAINNVGATAPTGGGNGGTGPTTSSGIGGDGFPPGGGGSGARDASLLGAEQLRNGGRGASGQVTLSYANNTVGDSVGDGIPDWWRAQYFGGDGTTTNAASGAAVDFDNDGRSNGDEYFADTDPTNAASRLAIISLTLEANDVHLTWIGGSNAWQSIENCSGLTDTNGWSALYTNAPPTTITNTVIGTGAGEATRRFYRIKAWR